MSGSQGKRRYFTEPRREAYLEGLRRTGNRAAAAREAGITAGGARRYRRRKPEFEARCVEAEREAQRRLAGFGPGDAGAGEGAFESIRRGADGRLKIQAQGSRRWSKRAEDRFFAVLRECGNIAASARAAGVSREAVWKRRREWPAFARRFEEALEEAEIVLEFRVACQGTNWSEAAELEEEEGAPPPGSAQRLLRSRCAVGMLPRSMPLMLAPSPRNRGEDQKVGSAWSANAGEDQGVPFDPELAMRFLKWRREAKGGRRGTAAALPPAEEVRERILRKVTAIQRHKALAARRTAETEGDSSPGFPGEGDRAQRGGGGPSIPAACAASASEDPLHHPAGGPPPRQMPGRIK